MLSRLDPESQARSYQLMPDDSPAATAPEARAERAPAASGHLAASPAPADAARQPAESSAPYGAPALEQVRVHAPPARAEDEPRTNGASSSARGDDAPPKRSVVVPEGEMNVPKDGALPGEGPPTNAMEVLLNAKPGALDPRRYMTKGFLSNCATFLIMVLGVVLKSVAPGQASRWILAFGVFGFAGGITNWLAVKMLFDRVPGLYGSGVIPMRFKEIREVVKDTMLRTFFDREYLERYLKGKLHQYAETSDLGAQLERVLHSPEVEAIVDAQLEALKAKPEGLILAMQGIEPRTLKPLVMSFIRGAASDLGPVLVKSFDASSLIPIERLREEIDALMTNKLQELTPERVKDLMEEVIRVHLGWLIVWGNIFGGIIGLLSTAAGYP